MSVSLPPRPPAGPSYEPIGPGAALAAQARAQALASTNADHEVIFGASRITPAFQQHATGEQGEIASFQDRPSE